MVIPILVTYSSAPIMNDGLVGRAEYMHVHAEFKTY